MQRSEAKMCLKFVIEGEERWPRRKKLVDVDSADCKSSSVPLCPASTLLHTLCALPGMPLLYCPLGKVFSKSNKSIK